MIRKLVFIAILVIVFLGLVRLIALTKVPCGAVGVRRSQVGASADGLASVKLLMPGLRFALPILHRVELISTTARKIDLEHVEITLKDNLKVYVDATTTFHVEPSKLALRFAADDGEQYVQRVMPSDLKGVVCEALQETDGDGFLDAAWRSKQTGAIEQRLFEQLEKRGMKVTGFFLRDFAFAASYEQELKRQRLVRQQKHKGSLEIKLAALEAEGDTEAEALRAQVDQVNRELERRIGAARQESDLIAEQGRQNGEFLLSQAELEGQRLMSEALGSANGDAMLKMELIEALRTGLRFVILRPSDLGLLDALGGGGSRPRRSSGEGRR
ncbi:MAG: hypothetical protein JW759_05690 [Candidatus Coatesbacteria bacterium]|nr:hypothetical protein [Candidatus Coatesbacteria bacterium]